MEGTPTPDNSFQIFMIAINAAGAIILGLVAFVAHGFQKQYKEDKDANNHRLNAHALKIDATKQDLSDVKNLYTELKGEVANNNRRDEDRMELIKTYIKSTNEGLGRIERKQDIDGQEMRTIDKRLTDYIISSKK